MRKTAGAAAVSIMPRTRIYTDELVLRVEDHAGVLTDFLDSLVSGDITCAIPAPTGFMMAMTIVAVVLPRALNHNSLYFVGIIWKIACGMLAKNLRITRELSLFVQRSRTAYLANDEESVGSFARERACSSSIANPSSEN